MIEGLIIINKPIKESSGSNDFTVVDYQSLIGSLQFLAIYTRPEISFAAGYLARWNSKPTPQCWKAAKRVLQYLKGTLDYGTMFDGTDGYSLIAYSDADWAGDVGDRKSTSGSLIKIVDGPIY